MSSSVTSTGKRLWRIFLDGACSNNHIVGVATASNTTKVVGKARAAGYGIWIEHDDDKIRRDNEAENKWTFEFSGPLPTPPEATNNRAELLSLITSLQLWFDNRLPARACDRLELLMDSQYVVKIATEWLPGWRRRGFIGTNGKPVLNKDLVKQLDQLLLRAELDNRDFSIVWTRAHQREPTRKDSVEWRNWLGNKHADRLACAAAAAATT